MAKLTSTVPRHAIFPTGHLINVSMHAFCQFILEQDWVAHGRGGMHMIFKAFPSLGQIRNPTNITGLEPLILDVLPVHPGASLLDEDQHLIHHYNPLIRVACLTCMFHSCSSWVIKSSKIFSVSVEFLLNPYFVN